MKLENLKEEYPSMPKEIRAMIKREVAAQMENVTLIDGGKQKTKKKEKKTIKRPWRKASAAAAVLAAGLVFGMTAYAGLKAYQWYTEKEGVYGLKAGIGTNDAEGTDGTYAVPEEIPVLSVAAEYLPDGMVAASDGTTKYYYEETPYQGGISISTITMDEKLSADTLPLIDTNVVRSEMITIQGKDAVYVEKPESTNGKTGFNKKIYIAYPDYWQILQMFVGEDVSKEEALKIAENLAVTPTGEMIAYASQFTWSGLLVAESEIADIRLEATGEEMGNIHKVGDSFTIECAAATDASEWEQTDCITAKVTEVQIADDFSALDASLVDDVLKTALDGAGRLVKNKIHYMKAGNGTDSLDEEVRTEEVAQKLVCVTVEYTNTGDKELRDILYFGSFIGLEETGDGYRFYDRAQSDDDARTEFVICDSVGGFGEMDYFDAHGGERGNNYISSLKPGETVELHIAKVVNEDELDKMYLSLDTSGAAYEFTDDMMETGLVDIRP